MRGASELVIAVGLNRPTLEVAMVFAGWFVSWDEGGRCLVDFCGGCGGEDV